MDRYLKNYIAQDLKEKMVFIGGPRQVGKTTLALTFLGQPSEEHPAYLNWDFPEMRPKMIKGYLPANEKLVIFDEIHKYKDWRNLLKGLYDKNKSRVSFLITGSARLDYYRRGGDALQGRYHFHRLHPFSLNELNKNPTSKDLEHLLTFGGFPEPLFKGEEKHWRRWQRERIKRVTYEDLVGLEKIKEVDLLLLLAQILPSRVGSPLSIKSLREDLHVAHETVDHWVRILENLYYCFRIPPFGGNKLRAVKKEQKLYLWDWSQCESPGARLENFIASQLLKFCHFLEDTEGFEMELRFFRDVDRREVDFIVLKEKKALFAVECKTGERQISTGIQYLAFRSDIPAFYQVHLGREKFESQPDRTKVLPLVDFCKELNLP